MAKNVLPVDFQDDILSADMDGRRRYQMITNSDGTVSFVDVTEYSQVGSNFGQAQINATNEAVNESADKNKIIDSKDDLLANTQDGMMAGALAVKEIRSELNDKLHWKKVGEITGTASLALPDSFSELLVTVGTTIFYIPSILLTDVDKSYYYGKVASNGHYLTLGNNTIFVSKTNIRMVAYKIENASSIAIGSYSNITSSTTMTVYYR